MNYLLAAKGDKTTKLNDFSNKFKEVLSVVQGSEKFKNISTSKKDHLLCLNFEFHENEISEKLILQFNPHLDRWNILLDSMDYVGFCVSHKELSQENKKEVEEILYGFAKRIIEVKSERLKN